MKSLAVLILTFSTLTTFSQSKQILSASIYGGAFGYSNNQTGPRIGLDLEARNDRFGVYFNSTGNFLFDDRESKIIEFSMGLRWYLGDMKKLSGSVETGLSYNIFRGSYSGNYLGINLGLGLNYPVSKDLDINLKGKFNLYPKNYVSAYGGMQLGLRFYFNK